jgi:hypothetical protein
MVIQCAYCQKVTAYPDGKYESQRRRQKYCSEHCRDNAYSRRVYVPSQHKHIASSAVGAASELRVCTDLLLKGFEVFRATAHTCSCDLISLKDGKLTRIEVKTGHRKPSGKKYTIFKNRGFKADMLAVVLPDEIIYHVIS